MADIAERAGVALSTVSYVLSGKRRISEDTRERVLRAIAELEYRPHTGAQALASGTTRAVALLLPAAHDELSIMQHAFVAGAAQATSERGYALTLSTAPARAAEVTRLVDANRADGVILMEVELRDRRVERLRSGGYPFSIIGHCEDNSGLTFVDFDFEHGVELAIRHLMDLGHRRIALFNETHHSRRRYGYTVRSRAAFERLVSEHGLEGSETEVFLDTYKIRDAAREAFRQIRPTAVVAVALAAAVVLAAAHEEGLRVPNDLSVVGLLSPQLADITNPPLTGVDFPAVEMGRIGAELLIDRLAKPDQPPSQLLLAPPLTIRESTARPRRRRAARAGAPSVGANR
jgi:DNA-binding LacI/PurR family transcriptional regulator